MSWWLSSSSACLSLVPDSIAQDAEADDVHAPVVLDAIGHEQSFAGEAGVLECGGGTGVRRQHVGPELLEPEDPEGDANEEAEGIRPASRAPGTSIADDDAHLGPTVTRMDVVEPDETDERAVGQAVDGEDSGGGRGDQGPVPGLVLRPGHLAVVVDESCHLGIVDPGAVALSIARLEGPEPHEFALPLSVVTIREVRLHAFG